MPWQRARYPASWEEIRQRILLRADRQCEWQYGDERRCAAPHHAYIHRCKDDPEVWEKCRMPWATDPALCWCCEVDTELLPRVRVVLTSAHTCACDPICEDEAHLLSLCQLHHNRMDMPMRQRHARATRRRKRIEGGQQPLALPL